MWRAPLSLRLKATQEIQLFRDGSRLDHISVRDDEWHHSYFPEGDGKKHRALIALQVDPVFRPSDYGLSDDSNTLGIMVSLLEFCDEMEVPSHGFWPWEGDDGRQFRWTKEDAYIMVPLDCETAVIGIRAAHPEIDLNPVTVISDLNGYQQKELKLRDNNWHEISFRPSDIAKDMPRNYPKEDGMILTGIIRILVDRTWVPARCIESADTRRLGVAVSMVQITYPDGTSRELGE
jgi:hypothetical protein